jgi:uncharacterized membrane protein
MEYSLEGTLLWGFERTRKTGGTAMDLKKIVFATAGIGAGLMYLFDPASGRRRRALIRDKMIRGIHETRNALDVTARDMKNRTRGLTAEAKHLFSRKEIIEPEVLVERVRAKLGGAVSHPGAIDVDAVDGRIILKGVVLANEIKALMNRVRSVRGVKDVESQLEAHEDPDRVPGLQGEPTRRLAGGRFELLQTNWSPAARFLTGLAGGAVAVCGLRFRGLVGKAATLSGAALFTRALTNKELKRIIGIGGRRGVDIHKTIHVNAPVETVFKTLSRFEDFPNFMSNVQRVSKLNGDRYRWTVSGPGELPVEWDSVLTSNIPNRELAWRTESGAIVQHAGIIKFMPNPDGSTTVEIRLTYNPPGGEIGHAFVSLVGSDPKTRLDEDLARMKTYIETGKEPRDAAAARH